TGVARSPCAYSGRRRFARDRVSTPARDGARIHQSAGKTKNGRAGEVQGIDRRFSIEIQHRIETDRDQRGDIAHDRRWTHARSGRVSHSAESETDADRPAPANF